MNAVVTLPNIENARLPETYQAAQRALAECSRIDECQRWADKAEALASYAKQSKDDTLRKYADRIQARAIRRCGELLKQIPDTNRGRPPKEIPDGTVTNITRAEAAADAGLSERQKVTALRVASVPEENFERQIESDSPPTITELAEQGKQSRLIDLGNIPPADYARATEAQGTLRRFAEYCKTNDPAKIAKAYKAHEVVALREYVGIVDHWLDVFVTNLLG